MPDAALCAAPPCESIPMTPDLILKLTVLAAVGAFTPGPNNALVASSGASFGLRRSVPHILGIALGFPLMVLLVGLFLAQAFQQSALLRDGVRLVGAGLLLWMAAKLWIAAGRHGGTGRAARPFTFVEAAGFQWINPKAWSFAIAVTAQFVTGPEPFLAALTVAGVFFAVGLASASTWAAAGRAMTRLLDTPERLRGFNRAMAALIAVSVGALFLG